MPSEENSLVEYVQLSPHDAEGSSFASDLRLGVVHGSRMALARLDVQGDSNYKSMNCRVLTSYTTLSHPCRYSLFLSIHTLTSSF